MYRVISLIVIIVSIVGTLYYKFNELNNKIDTLTSEVKVGNSKIAELKAEIKLKESSISELASIIEQNNKEIEAKHKRYVKLQQELEEWKNRPPEIKYKTKIVKEIITKDHSAGICKDGLELNKAISELNYEDL